MEFSYKFVEFGGLLLLAVPIMYTFGVAVYSAVSHSPFGATVTKLVDQAIDSLMKLVVNFLNTVGPSVELWMRFPKSRGEVKRSVQSIGWVYLVMGLMIVIVFKMLRASLLNAVGLGMWGEEVKDDSNVQHTPLLQNSAEERLRDHQRGMELLRELGIGAEPTLDEIAEAEEEAYEMDRMYNRKKEWFTFVKAIEETGLGNIQDSGWQARQELEVMWDSGPLQLERDEVIHRLFDDLDKELFFRKLNAMKGTCITRGEFALQVSGQPRWTAEKQARALHLCKLVLEKNPEYRGNFGATKYAFAWCYMNREKI
jgi:hypothetical protein